MHEMFTAIEHYSLGDGGEGAGGVCQGRLLETSNIQDQIRHGLLEDDGHFQKADQ